MTSGSDVDALRERTAPLALSAAEFRDIGRRLVDELADRLSAIAAGPVTHDESPTEVRRALASDGPLPQDGADAARLVADATHLLFDHSLFNAHPRFFGYITSSPAHIGILGDFLASALNQNVGAWRLAPLATEIERQTVRWIAELIDFPTDCGGLLVSGGNMANFVCFVAARAATAGWNVRTKGVGYGGRRLLVYASTETHTWLQKAADLFGMGTDAIRWVPADVRQRMDAAALRRQIDQDRHAGHIPFLVVGTAGSVGTGAVDPLAEIASICREHRLWFHVDGAYGAFAAQAEHAAVDLRAIRHADSVAVDPHKWLYAPLEAGCALVRDAEALRNAFSYHPAYYHFDESVVNYFDYGPQNSRAFRALKVWLALRHAGRDGCLRMISDDIQLARHLYRLADQHDAFEAVTQSLSITTFRYVPEDLRADVGDEQVERYLNELNERVLAAIEKSGEAFLSNAVVGGKFLLRACIVNFNTTLGDVEALIPLVSRLGRAVDGALRPAAAP